MLQISLQDGFKNDEVVVYVDGEEVYRKVPVTTRTQISLADEAKLDVAPGVRRLEIKVPTRGTYGSVELEIGEATYVPVSLDLFGELRIGAPSDQPFMYA